MKNGDRNETSLASESWQEQDELQTLIEQSRLAVRRADALVSALQARYGIGQAARQPLLVKGTDRREIQVQSRRLSTGLTGNPIPEHEEVMETRS
jgi:hypothetical protein